MYKKNKMKKKILLVFDYFYYGNLFIMSMIQKNNFLFELDFLWLDNYSCYNFK